MDELRAGVLVAALLAVVPLPVTVPDCLALVVLGFAAGAVALLLAEEADVAEEEVAGREDDAAGRVVAEEEDVDEGLAVVVGVETREEELDGLTVPD